MVSDVEANSAALSMSGTLAAFTAMSFWVTGQLKGLALLALLGVLASRGEKPIGSGPLKVSEGRVKASSRATQGYQ